MVSLPRRLFLGAAGLVGLYLVVRLDAHRFTANSLWARAVAWGDSDAADYRRFPVRRIHNALTVFYSRQPDPAPRENVASGFECRALPWNGDRLRQVRPVVFEPR